MCVENSVIRNVPIAIAEIRAEPKIFRARLNRRSQHGKGRQILADKIALDGRFVHRVRSALLFLQRHRDLARVTASGSDGDFAGRPLLDALEFFAPLDQHQGIRREQLVEA